MTRIEPGELGALICAGTQDVFSTMLQMELVMEGITENAAPPIRADVTALLGLAGALQGTVFVHCSREQGQIFTARLLGCKPEEVEDEDSMLDAIGEIANMVAGNLKRSFAAPSPFELAVPTVALSSKMRLRVKATSSLVAQFGTPYGSFHVEVILEEGPKR
jgi:chemotaxis protein CheX